MLSYSKGPHEPHHLLEVLHHYYRTACLLLSWSVYNSEIRRKKKARIKMRGPITQCTRLFKTEYTLYRTSESMAGLLRGSTGHRPRGSWLRDLCLK